MSRSHGRRTWLRFLLLWWCSPIPPSSINGDTKFSPSPFRSHPLIHSSSVVRPIYSQTCSSVLANFSSFFILTVSSPNSTVFSTLSLLRFKLYHPFQIREAGLPVFISVFCSPLKSSHSLLLNKNVWQHSEPEFLSGKERNFLGEYWHHQAKHGMHCRTSIHSSLTSPIIARQ